MSDDLTLGQFLPLDPKKLYPEGTVQLRVFDTKYGLMPFPVGADDQPTVERIAHTVPPGKRILVRARTMRGEEKGPGGPNASCLGKIQHNQPEVWEEILNLIARGESSYKIAQWLLEAKHTTTDFNTVKAALQRHRQRQFKERTQLAAASMKNRDADIVAQRINVVETMESMVIRQKARLEKISEKENLTPLLMDSVSKEGDRLMTYLKDLAGLYFDTGIMARAPKVMKGVIASQELSGADPIRGARIVSFELSEEELPLIEGIKNELGQYLVPAP